MMTEVAERGRLARLSGPLKIGLSFAAAGIVLAVIGIARGNVPAQPLSIAIALLVSGGSWGLVSWAVATAAHDVEQDLAEAGDQAPADDAGSHS